MRALVSSPLARDWWESLKQQQHPALWTSPAALWGTCSINSSIFSVPQVAEAWPEHCSGRIPLLKYSPSDNLLNSWEVLVLFFMVTSKDVLKVLWFSDSTQIISKNFNNYLCILKSLFTINNIEESSPHHGHITWNGDLKSAQVHFFWQNLTVKCGYDWEDRRTAFLGCVQTGTVMQVTTLIYRCVCHWKPFSALTSPSTATNMFI